MRVVVVGAGFAGACTAWLLRERLDAAVTILEERSEPGGMLRTLSTDDGLPYEYGPRVVSVFRGIPEVLPFLGAFLVHMTYMGSFAQEYKNAFYTGPAAGYEGLVANQYFAEIIGTFVLVAGIYAIVFAVLLAQALGGSPVVALG